MYKSAGDSTERNLDPTKISRYTVLYTENSFKLVLLDASVGSPDILS